VDQAGWLLAAIAVVAALLVIVVLPQAPAPVGEAAPVIPAPAREGEPVFPVDRFVPPDDPQWPGHWANPPAAWDALGVAVDGAGALEQAREAIAEMPPALREVIVLRDVEGATPSEVQRIRLAGRLTVADVADVDPLIRDRLTATLRVPRRH
jgi:hypothetical protein